MNSPNPTPDLKQILKQLYEHGATVRLKVVLSRERPGTLILGLPAEDGCISDVGSHPAETMVLSHIMAVLTGRVDGEAGVHVRSYLDQPHGNVVPPEVLTTADEDPEFPDAIRFSPEAAPAPRAPSEMPDERVRALAQAWDELLHRMKKLGADDYRHEHGGECTCAKYMNLKARLAWMAAWAMADDPSADAHLKELWKNA